MNSFSGRAARAFALVLSIVALPTQARYDEWDDGVRRATANPGGLLRPQIVLQPLPFVAPLQPLPLADLGEGPPALLDAAPQDPSHASPRPTFARATGAPSIAALEAAPKSSLPTSAVAVAAAIESTPPKSGSAASAATDGLEEDEEDAVEPDEHAGEPPPLKPGRSGATTDRPKFAAPSELPPPPSGAPALAQPAPPADAVAPPSTAPTTVAEPTAPTPPVAETTEEGEPPALEGRVKSAPLRPRFELARGVVFLDTSPTTSAPASPTHEPATAPAPTPTAAAEPEKKWFKNVLLDFRGFHHFVSGARPDWQGAEFLSYFDIAEGLPGAALVRHEEQGNDSGDYASLMLMPKLGHDLMLIASLGLGGGADFIATSRIDLEIKANLPQSLASLLPKTLGDIQLSVAGTSIAWSQNRKQLAQAASVMLWHLPFILELRQTTWFSNYGDDVWHVTPGIATTLLWGMHRDHWLVARLAYGDDAQNLPGLPLQQAPDARTVVAALGYRLWLSRHYGVMGECEFYGQVYTWWRLGLLGSVFVDL